MKKRVVFWLCLLLLLWFAEAGAVNKYYWATCRTGGGACLDGQDAQNLAVGDVCTVIMDNTGVPEIYHYRVYDSGVSEVDPGVIQPNADTGSAHPNYRWHLIYFIPDGTVATTQGAGDNSTKLATTAYADNKIGGALGATANALVKTTGTSGKSVTNSTITEDGTDVDHQAMNVITSGYLSGALKVLVLTTGTCTIGTDCDSTSLRVARGGVIEMIRQGVVTLPTKVTGLNVCVIARGTYSIQLKAATTDYFRDKATEGAGTGTITSDATKGAKVCVVGSGENYIWVVYGKDGTWTIP